MPKDSNIIAPWRPYNGLIFINFGVSNVQLPQSQTILEIPFHHLDPMKIVWHGHYWEYLEQARRDLLRKIEYDYPTMEELGHAWPIIESHCRYIKPITSQMKIRIETQMIEFEYRLKINYLIFDDQTNTRLCKASTTQVAFDLKRQEMCIGSPDVFLKRLNASKNRL